MSVDVIDLIKKIKPQGRKAVQGLRYVAENHLIISINLVANQDAIEEQIFKILYKFSSGDDLMHIYDTDPDVLM